MDTPQSLQILIAEDDYFVCKDIERAVTNMGYQVMGTAPNGKKAVEMTCNMNPDIILMDIQMPVMNGLEATQIIQEVSPTPVVILTAHESKDLLGKASRVGAGAYLTKPPQAEEIQRAISIAVARHKDWLKMCNLNNQLKIEISHRKDTEKKLKATAKEKEVLLKEIHHRVKNNFSVISSLLNLQSNRINNEQAREILAVSRNRVNSMAMIHQQLYQSADLASIDFNQYIRSLTKTLFQTYRTNKNIHLNTEIDNINLGVDLIIPCGLIINELLTNSLKYAFPSGFQENARIDIALHRRVDNVIELIHRDNGIGMPEETVIENTTSLGMQLVTILVEDQLEGQIQLDRKSGTKFTITFEDKNHRTPLDDEEDT